MDVIVIVTINVTSILSMMFKNHVNVIVTFNVIVNVGVSNCFCKCYFYFNCNCNCNSKCSSSSDGAWVFTFEVKFYPTEPAAMHEDLTRYLFAPFNYF